MKQKIKSTVMLFAAGVCFGCHHGSSSGSTATQKDTLLPKPEHTIVIIEENHGFDQIIGAPQAPFINKLANEGALFTDAHGVTHPSQPNYIGFAQKP